MAISSIFLHSLYCLLNTTTRHKSKTYVIIYIIHLIKGLYGRIKNGPLNDPILNG